MPEIVVAGAGGFIGSRLVGRLLVEPRLRDWRITATDLHVRDAPKTERLRILEGDLADTEFRGAVLDSAPALVYHLAGVLGGAAEADYALSRRVNVDATLSMFEDLRRTEAPPRLVFASSIAVFGDDPPPLIDDDSWPRPVMTYGAQKLMAEIALEQFSRRGWIDGLAIRLPGIVARGDADARQRAAFLNLMFYAYAEGRDLVLPVPEDGTTWMISVPACVEAFVHAGLLPREEIGKRRAFNLPAQCVRIGDLFAALARVFPDSRSRVSYVPDPELTAQFASQPPLVTATADALGFRHDGDLEALIRNATGLPLS